jgi:hypothetical protein
MKIFLANGTKVPPIKWCSRAQTFNTDRAWRHFYKKIGYIRLFRKLSGSVHGTTDHKRYGEIKGGSVLSVP